MCCFHVLNPTVTFTYAGTGTTVYPASSTAPVAAGSYVVVAHFGGNTDYLSADSDALAFTIGKAAQTIAFAALSDKTNGDPDFTISATASSGLAVSFSIVSGPATISGTTVHWTGSGTVTVRASQVGDSNYNAAPDVEQVFTVRDLVARTGFYEPVSPVGGAVNTVKGGSTVPLKFNVTVNGVEKTDTTGLTFSVAQVACSGGIEDAVDFVTTGGTSLRYDNHQFVQNWQTPKVAGTCYVVRMTTTADGGSLSALFKMK